MGWDRKERNEKRVGAREVWVSGKVKGEWDGDWEESGERGRWMGKRWE